MLIIAVITLASIIAWAVTARALFRRWVRNEAFAKRDQYIDIRDGEIHDRVTPRSHGTMASYAVIAALFLPVIAFAAFVTHNPPLSRNELETRTRALEAENRQLRKAQDRQADAVTCPDPRTAALARLGVPAREDGHHYGTD